MLAADDALTFTDFYFDSAVPEPLSQAVRSNLTLFLAGGEERQSGGSSGRVPMLRSRETGAAGGGEAAAGPSGPQGRVHRAGCRLAGLVNWRRRPCRTSALFAAANAAIW